MKLSYFNVVAMSLVLYSTPISAGNKKSCFYLDKNKVQGKFLTVELKLEKTINDAALIRLTNTGLYRGLERICQWSLNGGSGTKETFSLDGDFAVPILNPVCETPFSHEFTGIGFGDWYLTVCGIVVGDKININYNHFKYVSAVEALQQWNEYVPEKFPIIGDKGN